MAIESTELDSEVHLEIFGPTRRQKWITEFIHEQGSLEVDELSEQFQVSRMTIHRDLDELEQQGVLRKVRGGATVHPSYLFESDIRFRLSAATTEKEAIARDALTLVEPGQVILLDDFKHYDCLSSSNKGSQASDRDHKLFAHHGDHARGA